MKIKRLIPAFAMLLVSAILLGTSTFAWFSMHKTVYATDMEVKAIAEDGIVIASYTAAGVAPAASEFADTDATNFTTVRELHPTFVQITNGESGEMDTLTWYHASSRMSNNGQAYTTAGYTVVTNTEATEAVYYTTLAEYNEDHEPDITEDAFTALTTEQKLKTAATEGVYYYSEHKFQIKSTGAAQDVYVSGVHVTLADGQSAQAYDPSIRVLVVSKDASLVFAPDASRSSLTSEKISGAAGSSDVVESDITTPVTAANTQAALILDDVNMTAQDVFVYVFYAGEDAACKSDNITAFHNLKISVDFTTIVPNS